MPKSHRQPVQRRPRPLSRHLPTYAWMAALALLLGGLAALGMGGESPAPPAAASVATDAATPPAADTTTDATTDEPAAAESADPVTVGRRATNVGPVATDAAGLTLYRFDDDTAQPPHSACEGPCAETWLPLTTEGTPLAGDGIDSASLGTVARSDGSRQVTLGGWPVYRFVGDEQAGQTNGEGLQGSWHAIAPNGKTSADVRAARLAAQKERREEQRRQEQEEQEDEDGYGRDGYSEGGSADDGYSYGY